MNRRFDYQIIDQTDEYVYIKDLATTNNTLQSVTNAAEEVVKELLQLPGINEKTRIFYKDSENTIDELVHNGIEFTNFCFGHKGFDLS
jgi:hypothetical protein